MSSLPLRQLRRTRVADDGPERRPARYLTTPSISVVLPAPHPGTTTRAVRCDQVALGATPSIVLTSSTYGDVLERRGREAARTVDAARRGPGDWHERSRRTGPRDPAVAEEVRLTAANGGSGRW